MTRRWAPHALAALLFAAYAALSVTNHLRMRTTGYDLGIFEQAIRGYAEGRAPVSELKGPGFHLLGDHFHPVLMLLAPFYKLFPTPLTILVAQAFLFALSAVPVTRLAVRTLGHRRGLALGTAYGLSWGVQQAVDFDFHEIAFAVPLLAFAMEALADGRWRRAVLFAVPLLLVKEDLGLTLAAIGGYLFLRRQRALGALVAATGLAGTALTALVVIPAFNPAGTYAYGADGNHLAGLDAKAWMLFALLAPTLFLAVRSPLVLVAVPTVALRLWSTTPNHWSTDFHYDAVLMPILFVALVDVLGRLRPVWTGRLAVGVLGVALAFAVHQPLAGLLTPAAWRVTPEVAAVRAALDRIPDGAVVAADNRLVPQLTARCQVFQYPQVPDGVRPDWIVTVDRPIGSGAPPAGPDAGYEVVDRAGGLTVLRRTPIDGSAHPPTVHDERSATTITRGVTFRPVGS
ncbi:DUF2079 domain-containing protein [Longispora urticae]